MGNDNDSLAIIANSPQKTLSEDDKKAMNLAGAINLDQMIADTQDVAEGLGLKDVVKRLNSARRQLKTAIRSMQ